MQKMNVSVVDEVEPRIGDIAGLRGKQEDRLADLSRVSGTQPFGSSIAEVQS